MFCENCGNQAPAGSVFCEECGMRMDSDGTLGGQDNIPGPPPPAAPAYRMQQQVPEYDPQSAGYYGEQSYGGQPYSTKKTPVGMIIGIAAAVVVIGVGVFFGIRALSGNDDPASGSDASSSVSENLESPAVPEETPSTLDTDGSTVTPEETPSTSENADSPAITEEIPDAELHIQDPYEDYRGYLSGDEASLEDFFWFTEDVRWDGLPAGRNAITDFSDITGYWKAHTEAIPTYPGEGEYWKWFNVEISGNSDQATFTFHTRGFTAYDQETGRIDDISRDDGFFLNGSFSDGQLVVGTIAANGIELIIRDFYTLDGKQYAVGEIIYITNENDYIVLVRP